MNRATLAAGGVLSLAVLSSIAVQITGYGASISLMAALVSHIIDQPLWKERALWLALRLAIGFGISLVVMLGCFGIIHWTKRDSL